MSATSRYRDVATIVEEVLERAGLPSPLLKLLYIPLQQSGKLLANDHCPSWSALVFACAAAVRANLLPSIRVAAAVEMFMAAADVLDEIEDGDISAIVDAAGPAQALNAATVLMTLAYDVLSTLDVDGIPRSRIPAFVRSLTQSALKAGGGQFSDLASEGQDDIELDESLAITRAKAGALGSAAARLGALTGTDDDELLSLYETFGYHLATIAQLVNDVRDATVGATKTDDARSKGTLPRISADTSRYCRVLSESRNDRLAAEYAELGALPFIWVISEGERQNAYRVIRELASRGQAVEPLLELLS